MSGTDDVVTAAVLVIGDEILSGRTKDKNIGHIAEHCTMIGIQVKEVSVVPDIEEEIITSLNALRGRYTYVFTTGGIGPTHDDITADCVAKAFGVTIDVDPRARALLLTRIAEKDLNEARLRMARRNTGSAACRESNPRKPAFSTVTSGKTRTSSPLVLADSWPPICFTSATSFWGCRTRFKVIVGLIRQAGCSWCQPCNHCQTQC